MLFNTLSYLVFLAIIVVLNWHLPHRARLIMLFIAGLVFYASWRVEYLPLIFVPLLIDYFVAGWIADSKDPFVRKALLAFSLVTNLGLLFIFKYLNFSAAAAAAVLDLFGLHVPDVAFDIILPLGISFYTFHTISYVVDVYRGFIPPVRSPLLFFDYVFFFPQLIAGPILRAREVIPQLAKLKAFEATDLGYGLRRLLYGLFLKVCLADQIAGLVDLGFASPVEALSAFDVCTLAFMFGFQIYFDFSAYSHIAIGSARMCGIVFPENFNFPYSSCSPREFWQRWHISLSSWIRDYLYLPLTGARVSDRSEGGLSSETVSTEGRHTTMALFVTWALMGLWHGANFTFLLWGLWHAVLVYIFRLTRPWTATLPAAVRTIGGWLWTVPLVMLGWILFRATTVTQALQMYQVLLSPSRYTFFGLREWTYLVAACLMVLIILAPLGRRGAQQLSKRSATAYAGIEVIVLTAVAVGVVVFLRPISQFIYFQF